MTKGPHGDVSQMTDDEMFRYLGERWRRARRSWLLRRWKLVLPVLLFLIFFGEPTLTGLLSVVLDLAHAWQSNPASVITTVLGFAFNLVLVAFYMIFQFVAIFWFLGKPRVYWVMPGETGIGFKDYKGNPEVLESASRVVQLLKGVTRFKEAGGVPIRGLLLVGPPGTGKSYLGQAISTEAGVPFGYISAPSVQGMFWGMDVLRIWSLYRKARGLAQEYGACILFVDEIDAIAASRTRQGTGGGMGGMMFGAGSGALNQLLNEMDPMPHEASWLGKLLRQIGVRRGRVEVPVVLTMGATNAPDALDPALLRPGRFDRRVVVNAPSATGRREILAYYLSKVAHDPNLNLEYLVADTIGYTPVAIKHVINEALIVAHFDKRDALTYEDFTKAREVHEMGLPNPNPTLTEEDKIRVAYHEAGHAVAMLRLQPHERVVRVTIQPHGSAGGFVAPKPKIERAQYAQSKEELFAEIQVSLASRAAERLFLNTELIGVGGDFGHATTLAVQAVTQWGMAGEIFSEAAIPVGNGVSPHAREKAEEILQQCLKDATALLEREADLVNAVARRVVEKWEIDGLEFERIVAEVEAQRSRAGISMLECVQTNGVPELPPLTSDDQPSATAEAGA